MPITYQDVITVVMITWTFVGVFFATFVTENPLATIRNIPKRILFYLISGPVIWLMLLTDTLCMLKPNAYKIVCRIKKWFLENN